jgi:hypothetical protein
MDSTSIRLISLDIKRSLALYNYSAAFSAEADLHLPFALRYLNELHILKAAAKKNIGFH